LWLGFTATAASALYLTAGIIGFNLDKRSRFVTGTTWTHSVIWWEVMVGLVLLSLGIYFLRRGARGIDRKIRHI
jgi:hypothetical protein